MRCTHLDQIVFTEPPDRVEGCVECLRIDGQWVHLRMCQSCGHVGCCDSSPNQHASKHARAPVARPRASRASPR
jgi:Zn-finger in ubiquitin-hydrolases and other protein